VHYIGNPVPQLVAIELRIIGVLMEKQLTTPDQYPLTLNSIITACNQKSSREPVTNYDKGEVMRTLLELEHRGLVRKEVGSRSDKYTHHLISQLDLGRKQQAVLCVMMLRGPQTLSELHTRTQRMNQFSDKDELIHCVERLCERETPLAMRLGPGQRGERVAHLFSGKPELNAPSATTAVAPSAIEQPAEPSADMAILELDVASLRDTVRKLEQENVTLRYQLDALYKLTNHTVPQPSANDDDGGEVH